MAGVTIEYSHRVNRSHADNNIAPRRADGSLQDDKAGENLGGRTMVPGNAPAAPRVDAYIVRVFTFTSGPPPRRGRPDRSLPQSSAPRLARDLVIP